MGEHKPITLTLTQTPKHRHVALFMLTLMCFFWGTTFPLMKEGVASIEEVLTTHPDISPILFLCLRYGVAALCLVVLLALDPGLVRRCNKRTWAYGTVLGILFLISMYLQVYGLRLVSPAVSAFLTSLMVVFVPFMMWVGLHQRPAFRVLIAALVALVGVACISYQPGMFDPDQYADTLNTLLGIGLTLGCAFVFGIFVIFTNYATVREDPNALTLVLIVVSFALSALTVGALAPPEVIFDALPDLASDSIVVRAVVITAIFATFIATYSWNRWQRELTPSRVAVLYTLEPVFASIVSVALDHDDVTWFLVLGGLCIIGANLGCELGPSKGGPTPPQASSEARPELQESGAR